MNDDSIVIPFRRSATRPPRRAVTLIETMATLALLLVIALAAVEMLGSVTEIGVRNNEAQQSNRSALRFADRLRGDVKETKQLSELEDGRGIEILRDGEMVRYTWDSDALAILRVVLENESIVERDRFSFGSKLDPQFSVNEGRAVVVLKPGEQRWVVEAVQ
ncbi:MAG: prepilin-type N-terminal cleavage/methylation domain-containing protein [Planctomycetota bacterium]